MIARFAIRNSVVRTAARFYSEGTGQFQSTAGSAASQSPLSSQVNAEIPGLSSACVHPATQPVGPGVEPDKSGAYKVPEYFCYDASTYYEAEVEMAKFRCPQPSSLKK